MNPATTRRCDYVILALTVLSLIPFENGPISLIIPPSIKPYMLAAGVIAKIILGEMKVQQAKPNDPPAPSADMGRVEASAKVATAAAKTKA